MTDKPPRRRAPGKPFVKDDPRRAKGGRPKKTVAWKEAEDELRATIPRILAMTKNDLETVLKDNPTGYEMLAAKFVVESPKAAVERFLGKMPQVLTGAEGAPLVPAQPAPIIPPMDFKGWKPEQIDKFIEATAAAVSRAPAAQVKPA